MGLWASDPTVAKKQEQKNQKFSERSGFSAVGIIGSTPPPFPV